MTIKLKFESYFSKPFNNSTFYKFFIIFFIFFFHIYIRMSKKLSAKYYPQNKEILQKKAREISESF